MKKFRRMALFSVATAALASGAFVSPANAADAAVGPAGSSTITVHHRGDGTTPPAELGDPKEWGVVKLVMNDSEGSTIKPMTIVSVGGGTWSYGWEARNDAKYCYSNYYHRSVGHGSTVNMAGYIIKGHADAGQTSNAHHTAGFAYTCYTYYSKD